MPYEDPDPSDPMLLVGVSLPGDEASQREMAYGIAEEFARMGFDEHRILDLFRQPFYAGAHAAYRELGEARVAAMIRETLEVWGRFRPVDHDSDREGRCPPPRWASLDGAGHPREAGRVATQEARARSVSARSVPEGSGDTDPAFQIDSAHGEESSHE